MENCKEWTGRLYKGMPSPLPCQNKAWKDGYCRIHHPSQQKNIEKKKMERWEKKWEEDRIAKAQCVTGEDYKNARKISGLLTFEEARKLGANI